MLDEPHPGFSRNSLSRGILAGDRDAFGLRLGQDHPQEAILIGGFDPLGVDRHRYTDLRYEFAVANLHLVIGLEPTRVPARPTDGEHLTLERDAKLRTLHACDLDQNGKALSRFEQVRRGTPQVRLLLQPPYAPARRLAIP